MQGQTVDVHLATADEDQLPELLDKFLESLIMLVPMPDAFTTGICSPAPSLTPSPTQVFGSR